MTEWKLPWKAGCRCNGVRISLTEAPIITMACHCTGCQRMTGGPYSLSIAFPASGFRVVEGEPVIGGLHGPHRHYHCDFCKSWLFTRPHGMDQMVNVRATALDERAWFVPFVETATSEGFAWAKTGAAHSFPGMPSNDAFPPLIAAFAQSGIHP